MAHGLLGARVITVTTSTLLAFLLKLQAARSHSVPGPHGWEVYRLVRDEDVREFVKATGVTLPPYQDEGTYRT